jgi:GMP synthase (glutamine-hydrolysing)
MSRSCHVIEVPKGFHVFGFHLSLSGAAMGNRSQRIYGLQFHPEGCIRQKELKFSRIFLFRIAGCKGGWTMSRFVVEDICA